MGSDLHHETVTWGHFIAEEAPDIVVAALRDLLERQPREDAIVSPGLR